MDTPPPLNTPNQFQKQPGVIGTELLEQAPLLWVSIFFPHWTAAIPCTVLYTHIRSFIVLPSSKSSWIEVDYICEENLRFWPNYSPLKFEAGQTQRVFK